MAIRALFRERKDVAGLEGAADAVVIVTHEDEDSGRIDELQRNHQDAITTQLHDHMDGRNAWRCLSSTPRPREYRDYIIASKRLTRSSRQK